MNNKGFGVVECIIVLLILILAVLIYKDAIVNLISKIASIFIAG